MAKPADPATTPPEQGTNITPPADPSQAGQKPAPGADNEEAKTEPEEQQSEQPDPATTPDAESEAIANVEIGQRVLYPDDSSEGGWRYGRVLEVFDTTVELVYRDGSTRTFSKTRIRTSAP